MGDGQRPPEKPAADAGPLTSRRGILRGAATLVGVGAAGSTLSAVAAAKAAPGKSSADSGPLLVADAGVAVVDTACGKIAGYISNGIYTFKGIPYGATTTGERRFVPPQRPAPWAGVRSSRHWGLVCPQGARASWTYDDEAEFMYRWDDGLQGEDCLCVNVWTPGINDNGKRPVLVWLHGGGFSSGSSQESLAYDGENLARRGDLVVVSLNHRLNALGYLDLSHYGQRYASSGNLGMLDIVAALEWVRDNIGGFGGDPRVVTIFGQSGGAGKVCALMGMPAAKGLFHRAVASSGSMLRCTTQERSRELADGVMAELGLTAATIERIHGLPVQQIVQAGVKVQSTHAAPAPFGFPDVRRMAYILGFAPVVDGRVIPADPFDPQASLLSADVPIIVGNTLNEFANAIQHPDYESLTPAELEQRVGVLYGAQAPQVLAAFRAGAPGASPYVLWSHIGAAPVREMAIKLASAKAALRRAPAYLYWFCWQTPILGGRAGAFHGSELSFAFYNTDRCAHLTGGGSKPRALAAKVSDAWIHFARTGDPNHSGLPNWPAFTAARIPTMVFNDRVEMINDPDRAQQASIASRT